MSERIKHDWERRRSSWLCKRCGVITASTSNKSAIDKVSCESKPYDTPAPTAPPDAPITAAELDDNLTTWRAQIGRGAQNDTCWMYRCEALIREIRSERAERDAQADRANRAQAVVEAARNFARGRKLGMSANEEAHFQHALSSTVDAYDAGGTDG